MRTLLIVVVLLVLVVLVAALAVVGARFLPAEVTADSLGYSLHREADSPRGSSAECRARGAHEWRCRAVPSSGGERPIYRVSIGEGTCWTARIVDGGGGATPMPRRLEGCVRVRDQVRLFERL